MHKTYLVARRDYLGYVTSWGFWVGLLLTPIIIVGAMFLPSLIRDNQPTRYYTVIEQGSDFAEAIQAELEGRRANRIKRTLESLAADGAEGFDPMSLVRFTEARLDGADPADALERANPGVDVSVPREDFIFVSPPAGDLDALRPFIRGEQALPDGNDLFAAFIVDPATGNAVFVSEKLVGNELYRAGNDAMIDLVRDRLFRDAGVTGAEVDQALASAPRIVETRLSADGDTSKVTIVDRAPFIAALVIGFILWFLIFSVINYLLTGTIEERSNKIFDTLLTSVRLPQLLTGKLLAVLALSATLMGSWALGATLIANIFGGGMPAAAGQVIDTIAATMISPGFLIPAILSFVLGYLIFGSIFLALGSLCDTIQEAQTLMSPLLIMLMAPLFLMMIGFENPDSGLLRITSWIPVFTPFLLIVRLPTGLPAWEVTALIVLMVVTAAVILFAATKVYRAGAVHGASVDSVGRLLKSALGLGKGKAKEG